MKSYNEFLRVVKIMEDPDYDSTRFERFIEDNTFVIDGITTKSKHSSIIRFYESTNEYNQSKIMHLINTNISNIDKVYKLVIDYEKIKQQREI